MEKKPFVTEQHIQTRNTLRIGGIACIIIGIICIIIGFTSTFVTPATDFLSEETYIDSSFIENGTYVEFDDEFNNSPGNQFWLMFISIPLLGIGVAMTKAGYAGKVAEYGAREIAPVAKETIAYIKDTNYTEASNAQQKVVRAVECSSCHSLNPLHSKFCNHCGQSL